MARRTKSLGFGFRPDESQHHFVVTVPRAVRDEVWIAEHLLYDAEAGYSTPSLGIGQQDAKLRIMLARDKWNAIADAVRVDFNRRLKSQGIAVGRWKAGDNPLNRLLGKELTLLAWAIEDADPALMPTAIRNWLGLAPEERWWLFTMTNAATGHAIHGRGKGWRKAVRFALTENPVHDSQPAATSPAFSLVVEGPNQSEVQAKTRAKPKTKPLKGQRGADK